MVATQSPVVATQSPVVATQSPVVATQSPVVATQSPVVATQSPVVAAQSLALNQMVALGQAQEPDMAFTLSAAQMLERAAESIENNVQDFFGPMMQAIYFWAEGNRWGVRGLRQGLERYRSEAEASQRFPNQLQAFISPREFSYSSHLRRGHSRCSRRLDQ